MFIKTILQTFFFLQGFFYENQGSVQNESM